MRSKSHSHTDKRLFRTGRQTHGFWQPGHTGLQRPLPAGTLGRPPPPPPTGKSYQVTPNASVSPEIGGDVLYAPAQPALFGSSGREATPPGTECACVSVTRDAFRPPETYRAEAAPPRTPVRKRVLFSKTLPSGDPRRGRGGHALPNKGSQALGQTQTRPVLDPPFAPEVSAPGRGRDPTAFWSPGQQW